MRFCSSQAYQKVQLCSFSKYIALAAFLVVSSVAVAQVPASDNASTTATERAGKWGKADDHTSGPGHARMGPEQMLEKFDTNKDGSISRGELGRDKLFDRLDANKDGSISSDELKNAPAGGGGKGEGKEGKRGGKKDKKEDAQ